jgi:RNA polymerase subunit RPABC4/transcription elongation factor Spt4
MSNVTHRISDCSVHIGAKNKLCRVCGKRIKRKTNQAWRDIRIVVTEKQVSWFRGDDLVTFVHRECTPKSWGLRLLLEGGDNAD